MLKDQIRGLEKIVILPGQCQLAQKGVSQWDVISWVTFYHFIMVPGIPIFAF